jgi:hypothetical protein
VPWRIRHRFEDKFDNVDGREEISVLSSSRRENVRRQIEEIERYKSNPILYILSPRTTVSLGKGGTGKPSLRGWLSTVDLLIKVACFVKK